MISPPALVSERPDAVQEEPIRVGEDALELRRDVRPTHHDALEPLERAVRVGVRLVHRRAADAVLTEGAHAPVQERLARRLDPGRDVRREEALRVERGRGGAPNAPG